MVIGVIVMWAMLAALVFCAALWPLARHADRRGAPGLLHSALSNLRRLTLSTLLALSVVFTFSVAHSGKTSGGTGTTGILPVATVANGYAIPTGGTPVVPVAVTPQEIAQGYRLESVTTNDAVSYAMPTNGVEYAPWNLRGGYETHFPLDLGDFAFPFGTSVVRRLDVLSGGTVESLPRQRMDGAYYSLMSICAAREWASIVPGVGMFWWADAARPESAPYQVKLLTWENVYAGRDRTGLYSAQIEFHDDGNFITRSNNVERTYRRVLPYDLDNDGLPNTIDPAPEEPVVPSAWNQSEAWAAAAFPSNAAEIASMGGYAAWAATRGADPDRRLVSLGLAFDDGRAWPTLLDFGGVPVVADGATELVFAIDCGAKVPFMLTSGRLGSLAVTATEPPMRSGEGMTTTESSVIQNILTFPYERSVGDVKLHLDNFRSGWLCHVASVSIDGDEVQHLFPGDTIEVAASVTGCHRDAYLGCTWHGGEGITFSNPHSLTTDVTYASASTVVWATNGIDLVTQFFGYTLTNHVPVTVGTDAEPPLAFSLGCQKVFFLNDADFLEGACPSNRPERIRPVTLNLTGPLGTNGTARLSVQGNVNPVLFRVVGGVTNRVTESTVFPLSVTNDFAHTGSYSIYMSCPNVGTGTLTATFTPADGGEPLTDSVTFRCIEPLRKLVTTEKVGGRYVNPSRLVMGTNAVLKVSANGPFSPSEVNWCLVSGSADVVPNGWSATVTPTGTDTVIVEARFNDDDIQPRFVLPVVHRQTVPVKAFIVPPTEDERYNAWMTNNIYAMFDTVNEVYAQVGINFNLVNVENVNSATNHWCLAVTCTEPDQDGNPQTVFTDETWDLLNHYSAGDCVELYFIGEFSDHAAKAIWCSGYGIVISKEADGFVLAHELGHALRLDDCYPKYQLSAEQDYELIYVMRYNNPVDQRALNGVRDWGHETGRGFYEKEDTYGKVLSMLLMYAYDDVVSFMDIPDNQAFSLREGAATSNDTTFVDVGVENIKILEVYSR